MTRYTLLLTLFIALFGSASGQFLTWDYAHEPPYIPDSTYSGANYFQELPDGGAIGFMRKWGPNSVDLEVLRVDGTGNLTWAFAIPDRDLYSPMSVLFEDKVMLLESNGDYIVVSTSGTLLRDDSLPKVDELAYCGLTYQPSNGLVVMGNRTVNFIESPHIHRLDTNFNTLLDTTYTASAIPFVGRSMLALSDGNFLLAGRYGYGSANSTTRIYKFAPDGTLLWNKGYPYLPNPGDMTVIEPSAGNLYLVINPNAAVSSGFGTILRMDFAGDTLWRRSDTVAESYFKAIAVNSRLIAMVQGISQFPSVDYNLLVMDTAGNKVSTNPFDVINYWLPPVKLAATPNGIMSSWTDGPGRILQLDSLGYLAFNMVQGTVFADTTLDCIQSPGEKGFPNMLVLVEPDSLFTFTDNQGTYDLRTDSGDVWISMPQLPPLWRLNCPSNPDSHAVYFPSFYDTTSGLDFALEPDLLCPLVTASIAVPFLRPCSVSTYTLEARNVGTLPATNAYVDVIFDSLVTVTGMSCPFTNIGPDSFRVQLGTLPVLGTATCTIDVLVSCDPNGVTGRTSCAKARAYPDLFCELPSALWDSSSVRVTGACQNGDSIAFVVENVGAQDMAAPTGIVIAEDDLLRTTGTVQLNAGQDTVIKVEANGATWTLIADQVPFHPGSSFPRATVEACGVDSMGQFSIGHVTSLMYDDQDPWVDIHCQEITNSFDPNDKRGWPKGTGELNFILDTDPLEYMIRFQNTGTDTAFTVVIRDQLPPELDLTSLQLGLSSHPHTFQLLPDKRLEWTFANIRLPDSATNEPASHGYVTFRIEQVAGNTPGTAIKNAADIYFDFNSAIVTDTSLHTVLDSMEGVLSLSIEEPTALKPGIVAYPNPFGESVTVRLDRPVLGELTLELFDFQGRLLRRVRGRDNQSVVIDRAGLPAGMYVYRLRSGGRQMHCGKIIAN